MAREDRSFALRGGLDLVSSPLTVDPGRLWAGANYVAADAGYRRIGGYERYDGRPAPSDAEYWILRARGYFDRPAETVSAPDLAVSGMNLRGGVASAVRAWWCDNLADRLRAFDIGADGALSRAEDADVQLPSGQWEAAAQSGRWAWFFATDLRTGQRWRISDDGLSIARSEAGDVADSDISQCRAAFGIRGRLHFINNQTERIRQFPLDGAGVPGTGSYVYTLASGGYSGALAVEAAGRVFVIENASDKILSLDVSQGGAISASGEPDLILPSGAYGGLGGSGERAWLSDLSGELEGYVVRRGNNAALVRSTVTYPAASLLPPSAGDTLAGTPGAASAPVLAVVAGETEAERTLVLGDGGADFAANAALSVGGAGRGVAAAAAAKRMAPSSRLDLDYVGLSAAVRRTGIRKVPGAGPVRGVWRYDGHVYAFRDDASPATKCVMHRDGPAGWTAVGLGRKIAFDAGAEEPPRGAVLTGQTSGATATLAGILLRGGSWAADDATGTFYLHDVTGAFHDNENLRATISGSATTVAAANGADADIELAPGGSFGFVNENFFGQSDTRNMYGVDGKNPGFEWDGTVYTPLLTGLLEADEKPSHIAVHGDRLALGYPGGSLVLSETGAPTGYDSAPQTPSDGSPDNAVELACGQEIAALLGGVGLGNTLVIGEDRIQVLYGTAAADLQLRDQSGPQTGGVGGTLQEVGGPLYLDNRGVRSVATTQAYGNFVIGTVTADIQPWIDRQRDARNRAAGSMRLRSLDQYRLWFESGIGISIYFGRRRPEISFFDYGADDTDADNPVKIVPRCAVSAEDSDRNERAWFGCDNGFVYEAERGRSFDGRPIEAYCRLPLNHLRSPARQKQFFRADVHLDLGSVIALALGALYNDGTNPDQLLEELDVFGGGTLYEEGFYDEGYYDGALNGYASFSMEGMGRNVSVLLRSVTDREPPHTLNGLTLHYSPKKRER